ncbi:MAG: CdaR family protein [Saprospiraceae bacterium]
MKAWLNRIRLNTGNERVILVASMTVALVFWIFIKLSKTYPALRSISIEYHLPPGQVFASPPPATFTASCTGQGWDLLSDFLKHSDPVIVIDLETRKNADVQREELIRKAREVLSVKVEDVDRNYISFHLDSTATRQVPIILNHNISLAGDYFILDSIRIVPDSVLLTGPAEALASTTSVQTEQLTLSGLTGFERCRVKLMPPSGEEVSMARTEIIAEIPVEQFTEKVFSLPVKVNAGEDSVSLIPSRVSLSCIVALSRYDAIRANEFEIAADFDHRPQPGGASIVALNLTKSPGGIRNINFFPKYVELFVIQ